MKKDHSLLQVMPFPARLRLNLAVALVVAVNVALLTVFMYQTLYSTRPRKVQNGEAYLIDSEVERIKKKAQIIKMFLNNSKPVNEADNPGNRLGGYIMINNRTCKDADIIDVIILVHTAPKNMKNRQRIRDSFSKRSTFLPFQIRTAFLLGLTNNQTLAALLRSENSRFDDLVMGGFLDSYHNLTLKGVMGYNWVSEHCANARLILKVDDDIIINMYKFLNSFINTISKKRKSIFCNLWQKNTMQIQRKGKWKVASNIFYNKDVYPYDYCSGFVVVMTPDLMKPLYEAAKVTPFFWVDDVYLFGMLPKVIGGVNYYNYALDKNLTLNGKEAIRCMQTQNVECPIFASFVSKKQYWTYWELVKNIYSRIDWNAKRTLLS